MLQRIIAHGGFREETARRIFKETVRAVHFLHEINLIHRDLKPGHMLLTSKDWETLLPKLADFGLARTSVQFNDCLVFCGTPQYLAPGIIATRQAKDEGHCDCGYGRQADMWSLGVVLYNTISGESPFSEDGMYDQILIGRFNLIDDAWDAVTSEVKELVYKLMHVNPKNRLSSECTLSHEWLSGDGTLTTLPVKRKRKE